MAAHDVYGNPLNVEPHLTLTSNHLMLTNYGHHATTSDIEQLPITESYRASEVPFRSCQPNQPILEPWKCASRASDQFNIIPACCGGGTSSPILLKATASLSRNSEHYPDSMNPCPSHLKAQKSCAPSANRYHLNAQQPCAPSANCYHLNTQQPSAPSVNRYYLLTATLCNFSYP